MADESMVDIMKKYMHITNSIYGSVRISSIIEIPNFSSQSETLIFDGLNPRGTCNFINCFLF